MSYTTKSLCYINDGMSTDFEDNFSNNVYVHACIHKCFLFVLKESLRLSVNCLHTYHCHIKSGLQYLLMSCFLDFPSSVLSSSWYAGLAYPMTLTASLPV